MARYYHRLLNSTNKNVSRKVFLWDKMLNEQQLVKSWYSEVKSVFIENNMENTFQSGLIFDVRQCVDNLKGSLLLKQQSSLEIKCKEMPKLRTFVKFKDFYTTPSYLSKPLSFVQRKFLAKTRLGCLEIRLETGRYSRPRLSEELRVCQVCENPEEKVEN